MVYAITRSEDHLQHHGIKGQKWGKRRWQNEDGSLTAEGYEHYGIEQGGNKKLDKLYNKESKKMAKLASRTDIGQQQANISKYNKRAKIGAGVALGAAGVAAGSYGLNKYLGKMAKDAIKAKYGEADQLVTDADSSVRALWKADTQAYDAAGNWTGKGYSQSTWDEIDKVTGKLDTEHAGKMAEASKIKSDFNRDARIRKTVATVAGVVAGVSAGYAAYNKVQAHLAKKRTTELGHDKAVQKAKAQVERMQKLFANTPYADLVKNAGKSIKHSEG